MELKGYTNIPDWMLTLDLDVYETIILAVIYGFSQDGESTFTGSWNYLANKAKCSRRKVANALIALTEKNLVKKIDKEVKGIHFCEYSCTICTGDARGARGGAQGAPNNIDNNIDINKERENRRGASFIPPTIAEVAEYCKTRNNNIDAEEFVAFYESKGWMVGKSKMKSWQAAITTWEKSREKQTAARPAAPKKESAFEHNLKVIDSMFGTNYHAQTYGKKEEADEQ